MRESVRRVGQRFMIGFDGLEASKDVKRLIREFGDLTGVPVVLNTSFNDNEPIVCRPEEAIECFLRTKMDALVLGDILVRKPASSAPGASN